MSSGISIVIVSYNAFDYLDKCVGSLLMQKNIETEIIVVDNNSFDGTVDLLKSKYPSVKVIASKENLGFSGGNNVGIKAATNEIILLLNPDTELQESGTLLKMRNYLISNPNIGILAPQLLNTDGSFQPSFWEFPKVNDILLELFYLHRIKKKEILSARTLVSAASGAAFCLKKELADQLGGLDTNMFWMEDTDLCFRATSLGKQVIYNPDIKIIHHGGKSSADNYSISIPNQVISKIKYFEKNGSGLQFIASDVLSLFFIVSRLMIFALLSLSINRMFKLKARAYFIALKGYFSYNFAGNKEIIR
jgi:GT2 family glycosyltransferase